mmetsp:Transcript_34772/g.84011  ORF Transcript_34772/g.84011 Transcript_34772/m.84011 type:complete len:374 (+) Transcript_34772:164-1285(+)|eukprot:CAMPEP_0181088566 /NCGR_PEP_ID=MMETSP1071-20121207/6854_1 /TAXON_ID=35127 /ORGANISM="Thalassiosira sp., Strain NH16" /LENGTH=373 /DNA_ID=CAMNT_0023170489 /DNA_START=161 /DNA_END=1282 /DNA_ORIENTATION=-
MLNDDKDSDYNNGDRTTECSGGEDISMYSLVSETKTESNPNENDARCKSNENTNDGKRGLLILDGEEGDDGGGGNGDEVAGEESKLGEETTSALLSVPDTVFLPSEIRSVEAVSCVTREQDINKAKGSKERSHFGNYFWERWTRLSSFAFHWRSDVGLESINAMRIVIVLLIFMTLMISLASWKSYVWKNEALRLREDLQRQSALLPYTLSLLKEREALIRKQKILEEEIERSKLDAGPRRSDYDDIFPPDKTDNDPFVSIKNCYVEASLSLGHCSKEWQRWWSDSEDNAEEDKEESYSYNDGFTNDMSRLVQSMKNRLTATMTLSYPHIEETLKNLSYDGIRDTFSRDEYVQSILKSVSPEWGSNDTGDLPA